MGLSLCADGHEEICYDNFNCPICDVLNDKQGEIDDLKTELKTAEDRVTELEDVE